MMKKRTIFVIIPLLLIALLFCSPTIFRHYLYGRHPIEQPGTQWITRDGSVSFMIPTNNDDPVIGTVCCDGEDKMIQLFMGLHDLTVDITYKKYSFDDIVYPDEHWHPKIIQKNRFVVTVEGSDFFEDGKKLVFYKVEHRD